MGSWLQIFLLKVLFLGSLYFKNSVPYIDRQHCKCFFPDPYTKIIFYYFEFFQRSWFKYFFLCTLCLVFNVVGFVNCFQHFVIIVFIIKNDYNFMISSTIPNTEPIYHKTTKSPFLFALNILEFFRLTSFRN